MRDKFSRVRHGASGGSSTGSGRGMSASRPQRGKEHPARLKTGLRVDTIDSDETYMSHMGHSNTIQGLARARIIAAATRIWSADPSAALETVATEAAVGRATLHRYFPARADLLRAAAIDGILTLDDALANAGLDEQQAVDALRSATSILVRFGDRLHFVLMAGELLGDAAVTEVELRVDARLHRLLDRAVVERVLRADVPKVWRFRAIEALVYAAWTAVAEGELAANDAPGLVFVTMIRGLGAS
jgi:AcrR family transcriptional regulator